MSTEKKVENKDEFFVARADVLNATLQYLATRPYADVYSLIDGLKQSTPHVVESEPKPKVLKKS
jgi:hypothetical protein